MTVITSDTLNKIDRFRAQSTNDIKALGLPDSLEIAMRQGLNQCIDKVVNDALAQPVTITVPTTEGVQF
jgi:hypothetical protein